MASKHAILKKDELDRFKLRSVVEAQLVDYELKTGLPRDQIRVLDWGCGRGLVVLKLLELGYQAYGVDIDQEPLENGFPLMIEKGYNPKEQLCTISIDCKSPFPDNYFHVVLSDQVFEHISDFEAAVREISRITLSDGIGLHIFPARWRIIEPHLKVPFVHWIPPNGLRYAAVRALIKWIPAWPELTNLNRRDQARAFYQYSVTKTFYRPIGRQRTLFLANGFSTTLMVDPGKSRRLIRRLPIFLRRNTIIGKFICWAYNNFNEVILFSRPGYSPS